MSEESKKQFNILIIDDNKEAAKDIKQQLYQNLTNPSNIKLLYDIDESKSHLIKNPELYDVILLDANMTLRTGSIEPRGIELLKDLRKRNIELSSLIIVITGGTNNDPYWSQMFVELGAIDFIRRQRLGDELTSKVRDALEKSEEIALLARHREKSRHILEMWQSEDIAIAEICATACKIITEIFQADHSGMVIFNFDLLDQDSPPDGDEIGRLLVEYPKLYLPDKTSSIDFSVHDGIEAELIKNKQTIWLDDIDTRKNKKLLKDVFPILQNKGFKSVVFTPILLNNDVIASISMDFRQTRVFNLTQKLLLEDIATRLASSILSTHSSQRFITLSELLKQTSNSVSLHEAYSDIATKLKEYFRASYCCIWLLTDENSHVRVEGTDRELKEQIDEDLMTAIEVWGVTKEEVIQGLKRDKSFILDRHQPSLKTVNATSMMDKVQDILGISKQVQSTLIIPLITTTGELLGNVEVSSFKKREQGFPNNSKRVEYAGVLGPLLADTISNLLNRQMNDDEKGIRDNIDEIFDIDIRAGSSSSGELLNNLLSKVNEKFTDFEFLSLTTVKTNRLEKLSYNFRDEDNLDDNGEMAENWLANASNEIINQCDINSSNELQYIKHSNLDRFSIFIPRSDDNEDNLVIIATSSTPRERIRNMNLKLEMLERVLLKFINVFKTSRYIASKEHEKILNKQLNGFTTQLNREAANPNLEMERAEEDEYFYSLALTAITSKDGIRVNRAAIYQYNPRNIQKAYVCKYAIGQLTKEATKRNWEENKAKSINSTNRETILSPTDLHKKLTKSPLSKKAFSKLFPYLSSDEQIITNDDWVNQVQVGAPFRPQSIAELGHYIDDEFLDLFYESKSVRIPQFILIPLFTPTVGNQKSEFWGVLIGDYIGNERPFETHIITVLNNWTTTIMLALETRRLQSRVEKRKFATQKMSELMSKTTSHEMLEPATQIIRDYTEAGFVTMYEYFERFDAFPPHVPIAVGDIYDKEALKQSTQPPPESIVYQFMTEPQQFSKYFRENTGDIAWVEDASDFSSISTIAEREKHVSVIIVILRTTEKNTGNANENRVGLMFINFRNHDNFRDIANDNETRETFIQLIRSVGEAIGKAQLLTRIQRRSRALEDIDNLSNTMIKELSNSDRSINNTLQNFAEHIHSLAKKDYENWVENDESPTIPEFASYLCLYDKDSNHLSFRAAYPPERLDDVKAILAKNHTTTINLSGGDRPPTNSILGTFFDEEVITPSNWEVQENVLNIDNLQDSKYSQMNLRIQEKMQSLLVCIIATEDERFGVIAVESNISNRFTKEFADNVKRFARNAAIAIQSRKIRIDRIRDTQNNVMKLSASITHFLSKSVFKMYGLKKGTYGALQGGDTRQIKDHLDRLFKLVDEMLKLNQEQIDIFKDFTVYKVVRPIRLIIEDAIQEYLGHLENSQESLPPPPKLIHDSDDVYVNVSETFIRLVFTNLFINAYQWTELNEEVNITVIVRRISNDFVELIVSDKGVGMTEETLRTIFELGVNNPSPRRRITTSDDDEFIQSSIGMGLYNVRDILKEHNGSIRPESEAGKGTTFYIKLPIEENSEEV